MDTIIVVEPGHKLAARSSDKKIFSDNINVVVVMVVVMKVCELWIFMAHVQRISTQSCNDLCSRLVLICTLFLLLFHSVSGLLATYCQQRVFLFI